MTIFDDLREEYSKRNKKYSHQTRSDIVSKAYSRFKRGVEIRWRDLQEYGRRRGQIPMLNDLLVEIPQLKLVRNKVDKIIVNVERSNEMGLQVIYGEYGHGKSQSAQLLEEYYSDTIQNPSIIHYYQRLSTMNNFMVEFNQTIKEAFEKKLGFSKIEASLDKLEKNISKERFYLPEVLDSFIRVIQELTRQGRTLLIILDELDIILTNPEDFKPWGDLFVRLNDSEDLNLLLILLLPQTTAEKIKKNDKRLERWDISFGINSVILAGKYQNKVSQAIANILAMKSITSKIDFDNFYLDFASESLKYQYDRLKNESIRSVNIWAIELSEMFQELMDLKWKRNFENFNHENTFQQGNILEIHLRRFLKHCQLPDFKIKNPDTEDFDIYQSNYLDENLKHMDKVSDGQILINQLVNKIPVEEIKIAVEIKYTSTGSHNSEQISKIKTLGKKYPTIFFSLGSSKSFIESLKKKFLNWYLESPSFYPIIVIRLPNSLLSPLLILPDNESPDHLKAINLLTAWSKRFCPFSPQLEYFFKQLPEKLVNRQITLRIKSFDAYDSISAPIGSATPVIRTTTIKNGIHLLCSFIEDGFKTHKQINVLEKRYKKEY